ncbi:TPA: hypothetical protein N0F65_007535 [Lagenidium giganteum]|uniref:Uncharacterized protein n=1 Tax=Lagenidium giganteum TaxID=4803 RepID=A0AAV2ZNH4_9STRA|nr:TPA: hypothetical protein N0F65_007535 [Lagenidium giganteum]
MATQNLSFNAMDHLKRDHPDDYLDEYVVRAPRQDTLENYVKVTISDEAMNAYKWLSWVVMAQHELNFCEQTRTRKYYSLAPTNAVTLNSNTEAVKRAVQKRIAESLAGTLLGYSSMGGLKRRRITLGYCGYPVAHGQLTK